MSTGAQPRSEALKVTNTGTELRAVPQLEKTVVKLVVLNADLPKSWFCHEDGQAG